MTQILDDAAADPWKIIADLQRKLDERTAERDEALNQQTATAEVLQVINSSPGDLGPVFDAMLEKATILCEAAFGVLWAFDGDRIRAVASHNIPRAYADFLGREGPPPGPNSAVARTIRERSLIHFIDAATGEPYRSGDPFAVAAVELGGVRTLLNVPAVKDDALLGIFGIYRQEVRPFSEKQIALLQNFAAQAVIAMENARLLGELRERTGDLQESLEYQTATSDVLKVISGSTFDIQPVFETIVETAARLCDSDILMITNREVESYRVVATFATSSELDAVLRGRLLPASRGSMTGRAALEGRIVHVADVACDPEYALTETVTLGQLRTALAVPLLREGVVVGTINLGRTRVQPFTDRQIELVRTFTDQAVIAIENARLINETREALERQTATAEILRVINSSPGDLVPVFQAIVEKAHALCDADYGSLQLWDGEKFRGVVMRGFSEGMIDALRQGYSPSDMPCQRLVEGESVAHCIDLAEVDSPTAQRGGVALAGIRTVLYVALRKDDVLLGQVVAARKEVRPFSEREIALVENFAAQAVIAMENARLITETREALEQQTATAEVLQVINASPGDLIPVFDAMLDKALHLCGANFGLMNTYDGEHFHHAADHGVPAAYAKFRRDRGPTVYGSGTNPARLVAGEGLVHTIEPDGYGAIRAR